MAENRSAASAKTSAHTNSPRDYIEIGAAFAVLVGVVLALNGLDLLPQSLAVTDQMSYGLVWAGP